MHPPPDGKRGGSGARRRTRGHRVGYDGRADDYRLLFAVAILVNLATVFASTVMSGLMVEAGQRFAVPR